MITKSDHWQLWKEKPQLRDVSVHARARVCVCVIYTIYEVDPYAAMGWQVYSAQSAVASLRL